MNARRGELRNQLLHFVAQHGSLTIVGIATARLLEQLSKVSYAAKHVDQVRADLRVAGHDCFAQMLAECRKQTNILAHIQIKKASILPA